MKLEDISRAGVEFGNETGFRLQTMLGRLPTPQEFMAFYGTAAGTICGNALSEIVRAAGKEVGAQWLGEVLGIIQITARRNGADIILSGGVSLKMVSSTFPKQADPPLPPALDSNICPCEIIGGSCHSCERALDRSIDRFTNLALSAVDATKDADQSKVCQICRSRMIDGLLAKSIRKNFPFFGDRLPAILEIFMAVVTPQIKSIMPEVVWNETTKAVAEIAASVKKA